jgi:hypothetical protein
VTKIGDSDLREIPGFGGWYLIDKVGNVWSVVSGRYLTPNITSRGSSRFELYKPPGHKIKVATYRLIEIVFQESLPDCRFEGESWLLDPQHDQQECPYHLEHASWLTRSPIKQPVPS